MPGSLGEKEISETSEVEVRKGLHLAPKSHKYDGLLRDLRFRVNSFNPISVTRPTSNDIIRRDIPA